MYTHEKLPTASAQHGIRFTRFTILTWFPKSLLWQFRRIDNFYFLLITILTAMPFSPKKPSTQIATFVFILFFTMVKEAVEDYLRYKQDKEINLKTSTIIDETTHQESETTWQSIKLGQFIKVKKNQEVPADILILKSSNSNGIVYIDTMNIDGETNLKEKSVPIQFLHEGPDEYSEGQIVCDGPNSSLVSWNGHITCTKYPTPYNTEIKNLLLRGCYVRNTQYLIGVVVYIGHNTKIMKNAKNAPTKMSGVLHILNVLLYSIFGFQIALIIILAGLSTQWKVTNYGKTDYLSLTSLPGAGDYFIQLLTYWVTFSHLINISMYVVLQIIKLIMMLIINGDKRMYEPDYKKNTMCRTSDLVEDLGQIQYIFSDKTGTLTCNKMIFKKFNIEGVTYSVDQTDMSCAYLDKAVDKVLNSKSFTEPINMFGLTMCLNHTVFPEEGPNKEVVYQASNPDELALVKGAILLKYVYKSKTANTFTISLPNDTTAVYEQLYELSFDNYRKRMTVIVKQQNNDEILVLTKGADDSIFSICDISDSDKKKAADYIDNFARLGLRTLAFAYKIITKEEADAWINEMNSIKLSDSPNKNEAFKQHIFKMEAHLHFIGSSAVEDKLQELVPETLKDLLAAGIRVWVLTGDKQETAIKIGTSCNMVIPDPSSMSILSVSDDLKDKQDIANKFKEVLENEAERFGISLTEKVQPINIYNKRIDEKKFSIVINGSTLGVALAFYQQEFFRFCVHSKSVICCRVSPSQKAEVVSLVKRLGKWTTLSIGDGANDVPMLLEAHVGVGVRGLEGAQAILASDYAICKFKYLKDMLMFYGRCGYLRISEFLCYYFYKNCICVFTEVIFVYMNGFSGQIFFYDMLLLLYNIVWSSLPCIAVYALEFDVSYKNSLASPSLYAAGPKKYYFNLKQFWIWLILSIWHGFASFGIPILSLMYPFNGSGLMKDHWQTSTICFTVAFHVSTFKLFLETRCWHILNVVIAGIGSIFLYHIMVYALSFSALAKALQPESSGVYMAIGCDVNYWIMILIVPFAIMLPDIIIKLLKAIYYPNPSNYWMQAFPTESIKSQLTHQEDNKELLFK